MNGTAHLADPVGNPAVSAQQSSLLSYYVSLDSIGNEKMFVTYHVRVMSSDRWSQEEEITFDFQKKALLALLPNEAKDNPFVLINAIGRLKRQRDYLQAEIEAFARSAEEEGSLENFRIIEKIVFVDRQGEKRVLREIMNTKYAWRIELITKIEALLAYIKHRYVGFNIIRY